MSDTKEHPGGSDKNENIALHELLLKQQALLLQQSDYISKANNREKDNNDELDLSILIPGFLKKKKDGEESQEGTKGSWSLLEHFNLLYRNRVLLIMFLVLGIVYSVHLHYSNPQVYKSTMTVASGYFDNTYYASLLYPLEGLTQSNSYMGLAKALKLDTSLTKQLVSLTYRDFLSKNEAINKNDSSLEVINRPYFKIDVLVTDNNILSELQSGIFNFIHNNDYVNNQLEIQKLTLVRSVEELKREANWLDTLKTAIVTSLNYSTGTGGSINYTVKDSRDRGEVVLSREENIKVEAVDLFSKSQILGNEIISIESELLRLSDNLQIVGDFSANSAPISLSTKSIGLTVFYFLLLGLAFIYIIALGRGLLALIKG